MFYHSFLLFPPFPFLFSSPPSNSSLFFNFDKNTPPPKGPEYISLKSPLKRGILIEICWSLFSLYCSSRVISILMSECAYVMYALSDSQYVNNFDSNLAKVSEKCHKRGYKYWKQCLKMGTFLSVLNFHISSKICK